MPSKTCDGAASVPRACDQRPCAPLELGGHCSQPPSRRARSATAAGFIERGGMAARRASPCWGRLCVGGGPASAISPARGCDACSLLPPLRRRTQCGRKRCVDKDWQTGSIDRWLARRNNPHWHTSIASMRVRGRKTRHWALIDLIDADLPTLSTFLHRVGTLPDRASCKAPPSFLCMFTHDVHAHGLLVSSHSPASCRSISMRSPTRGCRRSSSSPHPPRSRTS